MYIVAKRMLKKEIKNQYFLRLNREESLLELYERADESVLWEEYPIRKDNHTAGCIRISQEDLQSLLSVIEEGTTIEM